MRLKTINATLAKRFQTASDTTEAYRVFSEIFQTCVRQADTSVFSRLDDANMVEALRKGEMPEGFDFEHHVAQLDEKYFDAEDKGRNDDAAAYFVLARLVSAVSIAGSAMRPDDYAEAAYEAIMSLPDPQAFIFDS